MIGAMYELRITKHPSDEPSPTKEEVKKFKQR